MTVFVGKMDHVYIHLYSRIKILYKKSLAFLCLLDTWEGGSDLLQNTAQVKDS